MANSRKFDKEFKSLYIDKRIKYFKEHFVDKDFYTAIFNAMKDGFCELTRVYIKFNIIYDCVEVIKKDNNLNTKQKKYLSQIMSEIKSVYEAVNDILQTVNP